MQAWQRDKLRADIFVPPLRELLARLFIVTAPPELDQKRNADLVFLVHGKHVATRMRDIQEYHIRDKHGVLYGDQITFRFSRPSGVATEFEKMLEGEGHYFLYAWGDFQTATVAAYTVVDLEKFRNWLNYMHYCRDTKPYRVRPNRDGTTFNIFDIADIRSNCIVAHEPLQETIMETPRSTPSMAEQHYQRDERMTLAERQALKWHNQDMRQREFDF